jgi:Crp-like helix-turn-helix protein
MDRFNWSTRSANARLAHLFCELYLRLKMVGLTKDMTYLLPATQTDLSDVLGLSLVHTNRTCAALRSEGLATFARRTVTIHDWDKLQRVAEFNPEYLHLEAKPVVSGAPWELIREWQWIEEFVRYSKMKFGQYIFFQYSPSAMPLIVSSWLGGVFLRFMRGWRALLPRLSETVGMGVRPYQVFPHQQIIGNPSCELCRAQMWLTSIEPDRPDHDKRTFECSRCQQWR